ncbi:HSP90-domain-containing protein [Cylindrobasidium torrendii FP15055 ss-10]|uniref:HSP90-domain-containing protein n=1 Tax=Cylindrobasidium torrendii FP15055 ss-10 TaxID=1314674 RepID=A0A0D7BLW3_9AGAR|nr:HSP90-domain-containing protein [Cylindrobasidium torrendii FP15055 ss-10]
MQAPPPPAQLGPLAVGWTEHPGASNNQWPNGVRYYFNANTQESTYVRPTGVPLAPKAPERPTTKIAIPGTDWLRVRTNRNNLFFFHPSSKQSVWTVPEDIRDAVERLDIEQAQRTQPMSEADQEIQRVKNEVEGLFKRKADDDGNAPAAKKARMEDEDSEESEEEEEGDGEQEDWEREAAEQLAIEAQEAAKKAKAEGDLRRKQSEAEAVALARRKAELGIPDGVELNSEEAKAMFKVRDDNSTAQQTSNILQNLLREKDINPLLPWDSTLPLFISDPRYTLLPTVTARRDAFDEYCRDRARELRASNVNKEKEAVDPSAEFEKLLTTEVKSTRTSWTEFRRQWKKDRRFYGWGRDEREREKRFREYLKQLGEKKRLAAQKAEVDFFALLKGAQLPVAGEWKDIKRTISNDPRYDAVGSSSLREELFNTFRKAKSGRTELKTTLDVDLHSPQAKVKESSADRKARALRDREQKVQADRSRMEVTIDKSRNELSRDEHESTFKTLLVDAIREPQMAWEDALPQLKTDPRYAQCSLPLNQQVHLFHAHRSHLRERHERSLYALFESHAPSLDTSFASLPLDSLLASLPVTKLGYNSQVLQQEFAKWQRERASAARIAFDAMLQENAFIEFWGRLNKLGGDGVEGGVKQDDTGMGEDEGEGGGGRVDMKALAKGVDVSEMVKVLKNDKRYMVFAHIPEQREQWLRLVLPLTFIFSSIFGVSASQEKHEYQSDVARMRKIVINSLYSHKEVFLRELISNSLDALEKFRITSLTDKTVSLDGDDSLNVTIKVVPNDGAPGGRIVITDSGIGMTPEELKKNLGTLAKSGTSEFLARAESAGDTSNTGNLIGAFGLGFYSSFLVADRVDVASITAPTDANPSPIQHVFTSSADDSTFEVYADPRGSTLGHGTEITLWLKEDALEYTDNAELQRLVAKYSSFSSSFPIYLYNIREEQVVDEDATPEAPVAEPQVEGDEDEGVIEDITDEEKAVPAPVMKTVKVEEWLHLNGQAPLWQRDPKSISDEEYNEFYKATFKDTKNPMAWHHFSGDSGSGSAFKAIVFFPSELGEDYWSQQTSSTKDIRLLVKRVFITNDLGEDALPKWASWVKVVVDAEDLPLNVSRETLQSTAFLRQLKKIIMKRMIQLFARVANDEDKAAEFYKVYGTVLKLAAVEDNRNRDKILELVRFATNQRDSTSLQEYVENKKQGQKQIFYLAEMGKDIKALAKSVFVEKLHARGYEVLLMNEPLDEIVVQNVRKYKSLSFQDVAKAGLQFGDEGEESENEKAEMEALAEKFQPLLMYLKLEAQGVVHDVVLSNRLVTSPCAVVAESFGYTANIERMMSAATKGKPPGGNDMMHEYAKRAKKLEINPRSPLIEGLLERVVDLDPGVGGDPDDVDSIALGELQEAVSILIDGALIRSGFDVPDTNDFFARVDRVLRRSLGVPESAQTDASVKPAPPVDPELPEEDTFEPVHIPDHMKGDFSIEVDEIDEYGNVILDQAHDEL